MTNTGRHPVLETVQLYVRAHIAAISRPVGELVGVRRVALEPGESRDVAFDVDHGLLAYRDAAGRERLDQAVRGPDRPARQAGGHKRRLDVRPRTAPRDAGAGRGWRTRLDRDRPMTFDERTREA